FTEFQGIKKPRPLRARFFYGESNCKLLVLSGIAAGPSLYLLLYDWLLPRESLPDAARFGALLPFLPADAGFAPLFAGAEPLCCLRGAPELPRPPPPLPRPIVVLRPN